MTATQPPKRSAERRELFGTLIASKPARTRSPVAFTLSIIVHVVAAVLLVVVSRPFIPTLAHKLFEQVTIVVPEEETHILTFGGGAPTVTQPQSPAAPGAPRRQEEQLSITPGPVVPIPEVAPGPETPEPAEGRGAPGGAAAGRSLADQLRPRTIAPRLSGAGRYVPPNASPADAVRARVAESLQAYNDSVAAENEARRRALDWTIKTKDGKQWGIGPDGKIHLGDITLPAVLAFSPPPGKRDEVASRNRDWLEIERQVNNEIGRQNFKDRVKAIRARKDKEREDKKKNAENPPITN